MALDDDALQAKQARTIVTSRIGAVTHRRKRGFREQRAELAKQAAGELVARELHQHARHAFTRFQRDVTDETVADDDVDLAFENIIALDEAEVIEIARLEQRGGLLDPIVTLDFLLADIQ